MAASHLGATVRARRSPRTRRKATTCSARFPRASKGMKSPLEKSSSFLSRYARVCRITCNLIRPSGQCSAKSRAADARSALLSRTTVSSKRERSAKSDRSAIIRIDEPEIPQFRTLIKVRNPRARDLK